MKREEHVLVLRHRTYGMSGTGPCAGCAYVIMKPFSAYAAYGKGVLARSDFPPMESMESGPCGARAYEFCKIQFFVDLRNLRLYIAAPAGLWLKS